MVKFSVLGSHTNEHNRWEFHVWIFEQGSAAAINKYHLTISIIFWHFRKVMFVCFCLKSPIYSPAFSTTCFHITRRDGKAPKRVAFEVLKVFSKIVQRSLWISSSNPLVNKSWRRKDRSIESRYNKVLNCESSLQISVKSNWNWTKLPELRKKVNEK